MLDTIVNITNAHYVLDCVGVIVRFLVVAAALLSLASAAQAKDLTYNVKSGEAISEQLYVFIENTCVSSGQYRTKVRHEPIYGKLDIRPDTFIAEGQRCAGHKFTGTRLSYSSTKGFRGVDHFSVDVGYPIDTSEMRYTYTTYDVTVNVH